MKFKLRSVPKQINWIKNYFFMCFRRSQMYVMCKKKLRETLSTFRKWFICFYLYFKSLILALLGTNLFTMFSLIGFKEIFVAPFLFTQHKSIKLMLRPKLVFEIYIIVAESRLKRLIKRNQTHQMHYLLLIFRIAHLFSQTGTYESLSYPKTKRSLLRTQLHDTSVQEEYDL